MTFLERRGGRRALSTVKYAGALPRVCIVVPCFNEEKTLARTMQSIFALWYPRELLDTIIVDDGSTDGTLQIAEEFVRACPVVGAERHTIRVFHKENGGKHTALNLAIQNTDAEIIGCLDADSSVAEDALMRVIPGVKVFSPADGIETEKILEALVNDPGPAYVRLCRAKTPTLFDAGYQFKLKKTTGDFGMGYINNIADSSGLQDNGLGSAYLQGFNTSASTEKLVHNVSGGDIHAVFDLGPFVFITEYVTALQRFSPADLTYNGHGAKPSALNAEATYTFNLFTKPSTFTVNYGFSRQALALNIPRSRYGAAFQMAIFTDTLVTLEYLHNINYGKSDTATGDLLTAYTAADLGKSSNTVTAQIGVYF